VNWNYLYAIIPIGGLVFVIGSVLWQNHDWRKRGL
jgi:uncharacterized membrane protein YgdD (TMEM256/DUF423 family)